MLIITRWLLKLHILALNGLSFICAVKASKYQADVGLNKTKSTRSFSIFLDEGTQNRKFYSQRVIENNNKNYF